MELMNATSQKIRQKEIEKLKKKPSGMRCLKKGEP